MINITIYKSKEIKNIKNISDNVLIYVSDSNHLELIITKINTKKNSLIINKNTYIYYKKIIHFIDTKKINIQQICHKISEIIKHYSTNTSIIINNVENITKIYITIQSILYNFYKYKQEKINDFNVKLNINNNYLQNVYESYKIFSNLVNEPSNILTPYKLSEEITNICNGFNNITTNVEHVNENSNFRCIFHVGKASMLCNNTMHPRVLEVDINSNIKDTIVIIGKGVTFDTGGTCLKPSSSMKNMNKDMAGVAMCASIINNIIMNINNHVNTRFIFLCGIAENALGSNAYKVGDIITSYSGKTIEIINTDAEGRLILSDLISYAYQKYNPKIVIDIATLTGAVSTALGKHCSGIFTHNDYLYSNIYNIANKNEDKIWRLPLFSHFEQSLQSNIADIKHLASGCGGNSSTAAKFLEYFVPNDRKYSWMHIDIGGLIDDNPFNIFNFQLTKTLYEFITTIKHELLQ